MKARALGSLAVMSRHSATMPGRLSGPRSSMVHVQTSSRLTNFATASVTAFSRSRSEGLLWPVRYLSEAMRSLSASARVSSTTLYAKCPPYTMTRPQ